MTQEKVEGENMRGVEEDLVNRASCCAGLASIICGFFSVISVNRGGESYEMVGKNSVENPPPTAAEKRQKECAKKKEERQRLATKDFMEKIKALTGDEEDEQRDSYKAPPLQTQSPN